MSEKKEVDLESMEDGAAKKMDNLKNNYYTLITGACGGLGRAFVSECAKNKENLVLTGTSETKLAKLKEDFADKFEGIIVKTIVCNLQEMIQIDNLFKVLKEENICVNRLINNAGVILEGDFDKATEEQINNAVLVNCLATINLTKRFIKERNRDIKFEVLTVSSIAASFPIPHMAVYAGTKSFLVSVMTALSYEYRKEKVIFSTVCPGGMETSKEMKESIKSMGLGGKLSCQPTEKVAKKALKGLKNGKKIVTPGFFNKFLVFSSRFISRTFISKIAGKIYKKSQIKRNF